MIEQEIDWLLKEKYAGQRSEAFIADVERLKSGEPLGYLIGSIPFLNTIINLDSRPLIPRTETEFWVEKVILHLKQNPHKESLRILDLCAGSGCIGVAIAKAIPDSFVDFAEIDSSHLKTIKSNCIHNNIELDRVNIFQSNLFKSFTRELKYDYILTNPPYIDPLIDRTETSVKKYEPDVALYGGKAGLEIITEIITQASTFLKPIGELWIEHEPEQTIMIKSLANFEYQTNTQIDQYQVERFSQLVLQ